MDKKQLLRILLVEDDKFDREMFKRIFKSAKVACEITECVQAEEAWELICADASKFDIAVIDQTLPGMTGLELCRAIHDKKLQLPLVLLTGTGSEEVAVEALEIGVEDYIIKGSKVHSDMLPLIIKKAAQRHVKELKNRGLEEKLIFLGKALDTSNLGVTVTDFDGKIIYTNPAEADMHGYTVEELIGKEARILAPEHTHQMPDKSLLKKAGTKKRELINLRKDGSSLPVFLTTDVVRDASGEPIGFVSICEDITERKQAEEALLKAHDARLSIMKELQLEIKERKKMETQLRKLTVTVEQNPATIIITDPKGKIEYVNPEFTLSSGFSAEETIGENPRILKSGSQSDEFYAELWETITAGRTWKGDFQNKKKNGELYWESASISPIRDDNGDIVNFVGIKTDVTERVNNESRLRKLSNAIDQSLEMVMITDLKGVIEYVNPAVTNVTGYTREEIIGKNSSILKSGVHTPEFYQSMWTEIAKGKRWHGVMVNRKKSGDLYHEEMSISPVKDDKGTVTHYVAIKSDITKRKVMEAALAERERRLRDIIETTSEGYWQIDLEAVTTDVNGALCEMLGYTREEMLGRQSSFFTDEENQKIMAVQTSKIAATLHRHFELTLKAKDGQDVPVVFNATTFNDEAGNPVGGFSFVTNISEQKENEEAITKAKNDAEEATKLKDKFVSLVSHDLKNPISRLMLYLDMLKATEQLSNHGKEMIEEGVETLDEMTSLINDVLNLTRIRGARMMPAYALFHPHAIAELAIKNYHRLADDKGVELINEIPEKGKIFADERLILEVLRNLISNAVKFCRKGCMVRIYVPDGEKNTIVVSDTGVGIKPEKMDALFRYEQRTSTKGTSGEKGTGLGLPLCLDIVEAHGGRLEIESDVGKGSNFYIKLPEIKPRVLIVDDDESIRKLFIERLKKLDIVIMEADSGEAALELIKTKRPQLFFLDLHMPGMSGLELLKHIKEDPDTEKIPVIVVTADKTMEVVDHAFMEGADDFIVKPFEKAELIESVERFIG